LTCYWQNTPKFFVSFMKTWWGDAATEQRVFITDGGESGLLDARRIELHNSAVDQPAVA